jgi:ABC-2 type transport system permease protein
MVAAGSVNGLRRAFVPVQTMPAWLRTFSSHSPITAVVDAARHLILNAPGGESSVAGALAWSIGLMVLSILAAAYFFRRLTH